MFRKKGQVVPGNAVLYTELGFETPRFAIAEVLSLHALELAARNDPSRLRYGHPGSWETTEHGPLPWLQTATGQEPLRAAMTRAAERRDYVDAASAVVFQPFGSLGS